MTLRLNKKKVLFVTAMSASKLNAIGVQTLYLAEAFDRDWIHCYWDGSSGTSAISNSYWLDSRIPSVWPFDIGRGFLTRQVERFGLGWWRGDHLVRHKQRSLRKLLAGTGFAYLAPLRCSEATKCREIIEMASCPFVVHLWDLLDPVLNTDYKWLLSHAEHVFCLSSTMTAVVRNAGARDTSRLAFVRPHSAYHATHSQGTHLIIGLVGFLSAYQKGLRLLEDAIASLRMSFSDICIRYIGPPAQLQFIPRDLRRVIEYIGLSDDHARDKALSGCQFGYLPGPMGPPEESSRSRHSIPSRSADYMANGLPIVAAAHPLSATSSFFSPIRDKGFYPVGDPHHLCRVVLNLQDERNWSQAAAECAVFFEKHCAIQNAQNELRSIAERFL